MLFHSVWHCIASSNLIERNFFVYSFEPYVLTGAHLYSPMHLACQSFRLDRVVFVKFLPKWEVNFVKFVCGEYSCTINIQTPANNGQLCDLLLPAVFMPPKYGCSAGCWHVIFEFIAGLIINVITLLNYTQHMHAHSNELALTITHKNVVSLNGREISIKTEAKEIAFYTRVRVWVCAGT